MNATNSYSVREQELEARLAIAKKEESRWRIAYSHLNAKSEAWRLTTKGKEEAYVKMEQQLAAAQARCDELVRICHEHGTYVDTKIDRSALDAAIAEAVAEANTKIVMVNPKLIHDTADRCSEICGGGFGRIKLEATIRDAIAAATKPLVDELNNIVNCDLDGMRKDFGADTDAQFRQWAQSRAKAALAQLK